MEIADSTSISSAHYQRSRGILSPPHKPHDFFKPLPIGNIPNEIFDSNDIIGLGKVDEEIKMFVEITKIQTYRKTKDNLNILDRELPPMKTYSFDKIFMGKRKFMSETIVQADYLDNQFVLYLGHVTDDLIHIFDKNNISNGTGQSEPCAGLVEHIPFDAIVEIKYAEFADNKGNIGVFAIKVHEGTRFRTVVCGRNRCLNPNTEDDYDRAKYIFFIGKTSVTNDLHGHINRYSTLKLKNIPKNHNKLLSNIKTIISEETDDKAIEDDALRELKQYDKSCKRMERDGINYYDKENIVDPNDEKIYLVYPIEDDAVDAVTIYNGCLKKLNIPEYLNDNLIDWRIKFYIQQRFDQDETIMKRIHAFSTMFFTKLTEVNDRTRGFNFVRKWTQNVDIFEKDFIFIPINKDLHWSLIVIVRPNLLKSIDDDDVENKESIDIEDPEFIDDIDDDESPIPCILHMDSLNPYGHSGELLAKTLRNYLQQEWNAKKGSKLLCTKDTIPFHRCSAPKQENSFDCGVFVIKYVEFILDHLNDINPTKKSLKNKKFAKTDNVISDKAFSQNNVTLERAKMRSSLDAIQVEWLLMENARKLKVANELEDDSYLEIQSPQDFIKLQEKRDIEEALNLSLVDEDMNSLKDNNLNELYDQDVQITDDNENMVSDNSILDQSAIPHNSNFLRKPITFARDAFPTTLPLP